MRPVTLRTVPIVQIVSKGARALPAANRASDRSTLERPDSAALYRDAAAVGALVPQAFVPATRGCRGRSHRRRDR
jgi:hypothetical protein